MTDTDRKQSRKTVTQFKPGNAGRPRGSRNKRTAASIVALADSALEPPHLALARIGNDPATPIGLRVTALQAATPYFSPRLAATQIVGPLPARWPIFERTREFVRITGPSAIIELPGNHRDDLPTIDEQGN